VEKKSRLYNAVRAGRQAAAQVAAPAAIWRPAPDCYLPLAGALSRSLWPPFGRGCRGPVEMNVAERDAARAIGIAVEQPQSAAAGAAAPRQSGKLRPLISLMPHIARYRWRAVAALIALVIAAVTTLLVPVAVRRMIDFGFSRE